MTNWNKLSKTLLASGCLALGLTGARAATPVTFDFAGMSHGDHLNSRTKGGITITFTTNAADSAGPDQAVIFDTSVTGANDGDLQWKGYGTDSTDWDGGNLKGNTSVNPVGLIFIIPNDLDGSRSPNTYFPDDDRDGGIVRLDFNAEIDSFGFDWADADGAETYQLDFYQNQTDPTPFHTVTFNEFYAGGAHEVAGAARGDNFANRISSSVLSSSVLANATNPPGTFRRVDFNYTGSGGFGTLIVTPVPEPAATSAVFGGILLACAGWWRRRCRA